jgi:hypothetical protein
MAPRAAAWAPRLSTCDKQRPPHLPSVLLLLRQRLVAAGYCLGTGLGTTITYVRPKLRLMTPPCRRYIAACVTLPLCTRGWEYLLCSSAYLPSIPLLMQQRRVAAGNGLITGLRTTIRYVRRTVRDATSAALAPRLTCGAQGAAPRAAAWAPRLNIRAHNNIRTSKKANRPAS